MPRKLTTEQFIERARKVHGDKYGYDHVDYVNTYTKVKIECYEHGIFEQLPNRHIQGRTGCRKCLGDNRKLTTEQFIERARVAHGDKYGYDHVDYVSSKLKVKIECHYHGIFEQLPCDHLRGMGCARCAAANRVGCGYYDLMTPDERQNISPGYIYIVRLLSDDGEIFDKIGITKKYPKERFKEFAQYQSIGAQCLEVQDMDVAWNKEQSLHKRFKEFHYTPRNYFSGASKECFKPLPYKFKEEETRKWLEGAA